MSETKDVLTAPVITGGAPANTSTTTKEPKLEMLNGKPVGLIEKHELFSEALTKAIDKINLQSRIGDELKAYALSGNLRADSKACIIAGGFSGIELSNGMRNLTISKANLPQDANGQPTGFSIGDIVTYATVRGGSVMITSNHALEPTEVYQDRGATELFRTTEGVYIRYKESCQTVLSVKLAPSLDDDIKNGIALGFDPMSAIAYAKAQQELRRSF